ncbi:flagellar L-ring protein precursor FlgH [Neptunomonas qingdaonensis]|uniref:Flagellar L-ring protein n=2 Tax=Neptunomonas qingdaonensis TaxID=1045558 RepID=A0A1I2N871_9GAMM|nr:flagellar L-ring protein precursor FlgH [Neptunomonas qingdaonensis]
MTGLMKSIMKKVVLLISVSIVLVGCVNKPVKPDRPYYAPVAPQQLQQPKPIDGSIFNAATNLDIYGDGRAHRVGDIITIVLSEKTQSSKSASTTADKTSSLSIPQPTILGNALSVFGAPLSANIDSSNNSFDGEGSSDMSNSLSGDITVTVHEVLPNGVLSVRGEKWMQLNQGDEYIQISGLVRPQDIAADNTIPSTKLADARIGYSGTGGVHDTNVMGWLTRFFISPLWPF